MLELKNLRLVDTKWLEPCTLNQQEVAQRLDITERYLRELEGYWPPRIRRGRGVESEYLWPAMFFWSLEFQLAQAFRKSDEWAFQQWVEKNYCMRCFRMAEERINKLVCDLRVAGASRVLIKAASQILEGSEQIRAGAADARGGQHERMAQAQTLRRIRKNRSSRRQRHERNREDK
jgi:hypothetical protein